jgi:cell division septation protein DedD
LSAWRISGVALALMLVVAVVWVGWPLIRQQSEGVTAERPDHKTMLSERTTPSNTKPAASLPAEDVPGKGIPDLPRYPGSVRAEYERKEQDLLVFTRIRYLSDAKLDVIRGFYRGVFRAEGWHVANVEFSEGEWTFLIVYGDREADIEIEPHGRDVTRVDIELSEPLPEKEPAPKEIPQKREESPAKQEPAPPPPSQSATPTPAPAPQSASPAPQSATPAPAPQPTPAPQPAPAPDDYEERGDDLGDDEGGDDEGGDD